MKLNDYCISTTTDIETLKSRLGQLFPSAIETSEQMTVDLYDTFDWRLHQNGWQLFKQGNLYRLTHAATGRLIGELETDGKRVGRFSWDFPASDFADALAPVLDMRAIMPVATLARKVDQLALCNTDDKTVARLSVEALAINGNARTVTHCHLRPVRGYGKESRKIISIIEELELAPAKISPVVDLLRQCGIEPGAYSSKIRASLTPRMPAALAVQLILENLVTVMHQNLDGVREDIDSEFLHDLRVAVRRARSLLGQTKGVLTTEVTAALQDHLKNMGAITGEVRDLDVYLLKKANYVNQVPDVLKPGILQLFQVLQRKRGTARARMLKAMDDAGFQASLAALNDFIQADPLSQGGAAGDTPVGELARAVIMKRFGKVIKKGSRICATTPDERLHDLRIDCKKLRYLLEFFTSLFPADEMKLLIKQLKRLQENLGDFNDLSVQQDFLIRHLESITPRTSQVVMLAAATGGLITRLAMDQKRVRSDFLSVFKAFSSHENKARFKTLFA